jgi:hypothetical protein
MVDEIGDGNVMGDKDVEGMSIIYDTIQARDKSRPGETKV